MFRTGEDAPGSMLRHPQKCPPGRSRGLLEEEVKITRTIDRINHSTELSISSRMTIRRAPPMIIVEAVADACKVDGRNGVEEEV